MKFFGVLPDFSGLLSNFSIFGECFQSVARYFLIPTRFVGVLGYFSKSGKDFLETDQIFAIGDTVSYIQVILFCLLQFSKSIKKKKLLGNLALQIYSVSGWLIGVSLKFSTRSQNFYCPRRDFRKLARFFTLGQDFSVVDKIFF